MKIPELFNSNELSRTLWDFRREFLVAGIFSMVANVLMLAPTMYMLQVYDRVLSSQSELTLVAMSLLTLFLFVVMMLDVDFAELKAEMAKYLPLGLVIGVIVLMQLMFAFGVWDYSAGYEGRLAAEFGAGTNTGELGAILYDDYILIFQLAGLVLLVAMIGAIVLTLRHRVDVKRQDVVAQMMRDPAKAMELKDVKPGQGL